ncbi:MAG: LytTR family DNA-binding domain-containing protein [Thiohalocapsa sp.]|jgi:two-component system response regulator AlgR
MKVLVVDDELPARERLLGMLERIPGFVSCGEASNGLEALTLTEREQPDIVLMDVRMPGMDGIEAARHLAQLDKPPAVIFATAYGEHALEAFETRAVGYLLKPVRQERLEDALRQATRPTRAQLARLLDEENPAARSHICARIRGRLELVPVEEVIYFQADQKYVTVCHQGGEVIIEDSLKSLEDEFGGRFLRIHRNALVSTQHMAGMERSREGRFEVMFRGIEERLEVSRRHVAEVRRFLKGR